ncbi:MAG: Ribonuclease 1 [Rickettsiales bacterium]|jgi:ribonuclease J|nr:Ribonuclease 1 [Rickettsiales bacterium]
MAFDVKKHKGDLLFIPLGGSGEIGMNVNLYQLDGKFIMCDLGAGFADDWLPGVDMIVADISFIRKHKKDLLGLVLTHAHEDHLGAVQYLWDELRCPIYATTFTGEFLKEKLGDEGWKVSDVPIIEMAPGARFKLGPFDLELVQITHSVPEMNGIFIRTEHGNVLHTGDWKLDDTPMLGGLTDYDKLKAFGKEGVLAMISDSTNIFNPGRSGSEGDLRESMINLVAQQKNLVVVTTFASNVARIETIAKAGHAAGRHVALAGRSLHRITRAARAAGYLKDIKFIDMQQANDYPRNKVLIISTGCQGEPLAATNKLATNSHPVLRMKPDDTIIFSSKIIPGNEKRIFRLFNLFAKMGAEVMTEKDHFVHVSGHPNQDEVKEMYEMVKPQISIPVHGELVHMHEHARLAKIWGVPQAIQTENGEVIKLAPGNPECVGLVESGYFAIDGNYLLPIDGPVMRMRRRIQRDGVIVAVIPVNKQGQLCGIPVITAPGALDISEDKEFLGIMVEEVTEALRSSGQGSKGKNRAETMENITRSAIRRLYKDEVDKNAPIDVHFITMG